MNDSANLQGAGPFADTTDMIIDTAMDLCGRTKNRRHAQEVDGFLETVHSGRVPKASVVAFTACTFAVLNKSESEPLKKRPIGAGTAPRRFVESSIAAFYHLNISEVLQLRNFCVGVDNTFPMHTFAATETFFKCVHRTAAEIKHNPPTQVGVSTDAASMFNTTNQDECARTLAKKMPTLYHFYQNMYRRDLRIWFPDEDGFPRFFSHKDGHIQGGPLSGTFSPITIMPLIKDIKSHM